jgi:hypothetical protein
MGGGDPLRQLLHELHVRGGQEFGHGRTVAAIRERVEPFSGPAE